MLRLYKQSIGFMRRSATSFRFDNFSRETFFFRNEILSGLDRPLSCCQIQVLCYWIASIKSVSQKQFDHNVLLRRSAVYCDVESSSRGEFNDPLDT